MQSSLLRHVSRRGVQLGLFYTRNSSCLLDAEVHNTRVTTGLFVFTSHYCSCSVYWSISVARVFVFVCGRLDMELAALTRRRSCLMVCPEAGSCLAGSGSHCVARVDSRVLTRTRMCVLVRVGV